MISVLATTSLLAVLARLALASGVSSFPASKHGPIGYHGPLAMAVVQKDGHLADTVEVAAARGQHLIATLKAQSASGYGAASYDDGSSGKYYDGGYEGALHGAYSGGQGTADVYNGQYGYAGLESFSSDAHASSGYGAGLSSSGGHSFSAGASQVGGNAYHGPLAAPVVLKSGYLAETQDVAAAKGAHYVALSQASQKSSGHHY